MLFTQCLLIALVLCITLLYLYCRRIYGYWKVRGVPYEEPTMLVGNLGFLMRTSVWDYMYYLAKKYKDDYVGIFLGLKPTLVINSKELAKKVLVTDFNNFQNRYSYAGDKADPLGALNLFTLKNPTWNPIRQEMTPMFTSLRLKEVTELMNINAAELVKRIQRDYIDNNKIVELKELFAMYASDTVGSTAFGLRVSALRDLTSPLWFMTQHMVRWSLWRGLEFTLCMIMPVAAQILRLKFFSATATDYIKQMFYTVAEERKKFNLSSGNDLVNHLIKLKDKLKLIAEENSVSAEDLMLAQTAVFIIGAIDTSSSALCFFFHELAHNPDIQDKLYMEIRTALKEKNKDVLDFNDLLELTYLSACIKETLRKYPAVGFLDRVCMNDYKLTDEVTIEKDVPVYVNVSAIHYNEEYYPEPHVWRPERFEGSGDNDNRDFTFITFGEGPRGCIAKRYGFMQLRTAIAHMVMKFRLEPDEEYAVKLHPYSIVLVPQSGGKVKFVART